MSLPRVAIVGRPNVGKSSLLNRLARRRVSIVDPTPGVTRDRVSVMLEIDAPDEAPRGTPARWIELVDTGGFGVYTAEGGRFDEIGADLAQLTPDIERQIGRAIDEADLVLFVIDARDGVTPLDDVVARLLRERGAAAKTQPVANKVDGESWIAHGAEASKLGFGEPVCVSAMNGQGQGRLVDAIWRRTERAAGDADAEAELRLAIVGRRNAGKSTLINALAGEERVIVSEIAGTTRDAVDVRFEIEGRRLLAIDTAGVRKRKSITGPIELYAYDRMLRAIDHCDVAMLLLDATTDVSSVDQKLGAELQERFTPTIIAVNKWDLVAERIGPDDYLEYLTQELRGLDFAPIAFLSATTGEGVRDAVAMAFNLHAQAAHRVGTGELNRIVQEILDRRGPTSRLGTQARVYFAAQVAVHPPTIVLVVNDPKLFRGRYERYLLNRLREELPYSEVPIRLLFRARKRMDIEAMKQQGRGRRE